MTQDVSIVCGELLYTVTVHHIDVSIMSVEVLYDTLQPLLISAIRGEVIYTGAYRQNIITMRAEVLYSNRKWLVNPDRERRHAYVSGHG